MSQKKTRPDQTEKLLEAWNDVFADIINVTVYNGERAIKEEYLIDGPTVSQYKAAEGQYNEKTRDVCKEDVRNGVTFTIWGLENQSDVNRVMPVRCMGYDYASYERTVRRLKEKNKNENNIPKYTEEIKRGQVLCPVVTIVLYFGIEKWDAPTDLWELANVPDELRPFVPNYHINLVQVAFLPDDVIEKFTSDFRHIAEFFQAKRLGKENELRYNKRKWEHVAEMMDFLHTFTKDRSYQEKKAAMIEESRKGEASMCTLIELVEKETAERVEKETAERVEKETAERVEKETAERVEKETAERVEKETAERVEKETAERVEKETRYKILEQLVRKTGNTVDVVMVMLDFSPEEKVEYESWKATGKI